MTDKLIYDNKCWGRTAVVGCFNNVLVHQAFVEKNESSVHLHNNDFNVIISVTAIIRILFYDDGPKAEPTSSFVLEPGCKIVIQPNRIHKFVVIDPGVILEIYYSLNHEFDIKRFDD